MTEREREMAYDLGARYADRYSGICSKMVDGELHYQWRCCACTERGDLVRKPSRDEYDAIRRELAAHERSHAAKEKGNAER